MHVYNTFQGLNSHCISHNASLLLYNVTLVDNAKLAYTVWYEFRALVYMHLL